MRVLFIEARVILVSTTDQNATNSVLALLSSNMSTLEASYSKSSFKLPNVVPEKLNDDRRRKDDARDVLSKAMFYQLDTPAENLAAYNRYGNGLISTIAMCYSGHYKLVIRPDDIMHSVWSAFALFVNAHPEEMRPYLVKHKEGKITIEIAAGSSFVPSVEALTPTIHAARTKMMPLLDAKFAEWLELSFSTTTDFDRLVATVELMGAVKKFVGCRFTYCCGLPEVELLGTLEDWTQLKTKMDFLTTIEHPAIQKWAAQLTNIANEFYESYQGNVNVAFWESVCKIKRRGSGGQSTVSGWCLAFAPFDSRGEYMTAADGEDIVGMCETEIEINDNGDQWTLMAKAGSYGSTLNMDDHSIRPANGLIFWRK